MLEVRRPCGRRDIKRKRLARRSSRTELFNAFMESCGPASGVAGVRGDDLPASSEPSSALFDLGGIACHHFPMCASA
jgi:hypothetical protein